MQQTTISQPTGRPWALAARVLPPVMRAAKPKVVRLISTQSTMARRMPAARPQWTSVPGIEPMR